MIINVIVKFLYEDLLMPDDTHRVRSQKKLIAFIMPFASIPLVNILLTLLQKKFDSPSEILKFLVRIVMLMSILLFWGTTRYKRAYTDAMGHAFYLVINVCYLANTLTDPNTGSEGVLVAFVIAFMLSDAQAIFKPSMYFPFLTAGIMAYNKSFGRPGTGHTPFVFPGAKDLEGVELFLTYLYGISIWIIALFVIYLQNKEYLRLMAASTAAVSCRVTLPRNLQRTTRPVR